MVQAAPRRDERLGRYPNILRNGQKIGLVRLEKADQGREQGRIGRPAPELICPDSGQVQEPPGPAFVTKRCRKGGKGKGQRIIWRLRWHGLERL